MSVALGRAIYVVPVAFAAGMLLKDWREDKDRRAAIIEKRVQQRLGEWTPPPLSPAERAALLSERASILGDIRRLEGGRHGPG